MDKQRPIIVIALITAACLLGDSMLYIVLPVHWDEMGLTSLWQVGIILAMNRIVRIPLNPLVSRLYQKISARSGIGSRLALFIALQCTAGCRGRASRARRSVRPARRNEKGRERLSSPAACSSCGLP